MAAFGEIMSGIGQILSSPFKNPSALWMILPIMILWIVLVIYFDEHKKEKLGWNTAIGNGISMFWISVALMRQIFVTKSFSLPKLSIVIFVLAYALFIAITSFSHAFKANVAYALAAPTPVYYLSSIAVMVAYDSLILTRWVLLGLIIIFVVMMLLGLILRKIIPDSKKGSDDFEAMDDSSSDLGLDSKSNGKEDDFLKDLKI